MLILNRLFINKHINTFRLTPKNCFSLFFLEPLTPFIKTYGLVNCTFVLNNDRPAFSGYKLTGCDLIRIRELPDPDPIQTASDPWSLTFIRRIGSNTDTTHGSMALLSFSSIGCLDSWQSSIWSPTTGRRSRVSLYL